MESNLFRFYYATIPLQCVSAVVFNSHKGSFLQKAFSPKKMFTILYTRPMRVRCAHFPSGITIITYVWLNALYIHLSWTIVTWIPRSRTAQYMGGQLKRRNSQFFQSAKCDFVFFLAKKTFLHWIRPRNIPGIYYVNKRTQTVVKYCLTIFQWSKNAQFVKGAKSIWHTQSKDWEKMANFITKSRK
jgi:hypothetical protein